MKKSEIKLTKDQAIKLLDTRLAAVFDRISTEDKKFIVKDLLRILALFDKNVIVDYKEKVDE